MKTTKKQQAEHRKFEKRVLALSGSDLRRAAELFFKLSQVAYGKLTRTKPREQIHRYSLN